MATSSSSKTDKEKKKEKKGRVRIVRKKGPGLCASVVSLLVLIVFASILAIWVSTETRSRAMHGHNPHAILVPGTFVGTSYYTIPDEFTQDVCLIAGYEDTVMGGEVVDVVCDQDVDTSKSSLFYTTLKRIEMSPQVVTFERVDDEGITHLINTTVQPDNTIKHWPCINSYDCQELCKACDDSCTLVQRTFPMLLNAKIVAQKGEWVNKFNLTLPLTWSTASRISNQVACDYRTHPNGTVYDMYTSMSGLRNDAWFAAILTAIVVAVVVVCLLVLLCLCMCCT
jgi:hypothetical protein